MLPYYLPRAYNAPLAVHLLDIRFSQLILYCFRKMMYHFRLHPYIVFIIKKSISNRSSPELEPESVDKVFIKTHSYGFPLDSSGF